ncbi:Chitin synthase, class 2 [Nowakowskiella sp. JEL0407]|nr:Chitin synthase, class 2 [Nowakowskiella sp. JEL0407]
MSQNPRIRFNEPNTTYSGPPSNVSSENKKPQYFGQFDQTNSSYSGSAGPFDYENDSYIDDDDSTSVTPEPYAQGLASNQLRQRVVGTGAGLTLQRTKKTVKLSSNGNFVIKHRVPDELLTNALFARGEEFETMRYTAATCDPNDFVANGYNLRLASYGRNIEMFIVVTMYNEDHTLFSRTMFALAQNIKYMCEKNEWGWNQDSWKKITIVIVADGRSKVHPNVLKVLESMGVYQDGLAQASINGNPVQAHIYEYTAQVVMDERYQFWGHSEELPPIQTIFVMKEKNKKKINSHRWFLKGLCPIVEPRVVVLIDVGTKPEKSALFNLWSTFFRNEQIAGACGEIRADLGSGIGYCKSLLNPLVASQNFEYKISNLLDKSLESVFGYITVLPGAFSAYRYKALLDTGPGIGPMAKYFEGESQTQKASDSSIFSANLYLAEDRILCFELVAKQDSRWTLHYVKNAYADTDVPDTIPEFLSQRRRWLNGSLFAGFYAIANIGRMWSSGHSFLRKFVFTLQFLYNVFNQIFNWFVLGNFAVTFFFLFEELKTLLSDKPLNGETTIRTKIINVIISIANYSYPITLVCLFVIAFGNRPQAFANVYRAVVIGFSIIGAVMLFLIGRRIATLSQARTAELDKAYAKLLNTYKYVNQTVPIQQIKMNTGGAPTKQDQGQILIAQMISKMAEVMDDQLQTNLKLTNTMSYNYIITLGATIGVFFLASILQGDVSHMFTCFIQYMLLLPSYINVLTVYALSNLHDVSWGTKGESKAEALPDIALVKQKDGSVTADVAVVLNKQDLSAHYRELITVLQTGLPGSAENDKAARKKAINPEQKQEDDYKSFRTWLVLSYLATNAIVYGIATFLSREIYLYFLLYSVAGLTLIKMVGVIFFISFRFFTDRLNVNNQGRKRYLAQFGSSGQGPAKTKNDRKTSLDHMEDAQRKYPNPKFVEEGEYYSQKSPALSQHPPIQQYAPQPPPQSYYNQQNYDQRPLDQPSIQFNIPSQMYSHKKYQQQPQYPVSHQNRQYIPPPVPLGITNDNRNNRVSFVSVANTMAYGDS